MLELGRKHWPKTNLIFCLLPSKPRNYMHHTWRPLLVLSKWKSVEVWGPLVERRGVMKWSGLTMMVAVMVNLHFGFTWNHLGDTLSGCVCENGEGKTNPKCGWHNPTDWDFRLNEKQKEEKASRAPAFTPLPAEGRLVPQPACSLPWSIASLKLWAQTNSSSFKPPFSGVLLTQWWEK